MIFYSQVKAEIIYILVWLQVRLGFVALFLLQTLGCYFRSLNSFHFVQEKDRKKVTSPSEARTRYRAKREKETFLCIAFSFCRCQARAPQVDSLVMSILLDGFLLLARTLSIPAPTPILPIHTELNVNINSFGHISKDSKPQI